MQNPPPPPPPTGAVWAVSWRPGGGCATSGGSLEPQRAHATFVLQTFSTVRPPAAAICDLQIFSGAGGLGEFSGRPGPKTGKKGGWERVRHLGLPRVYPGTPLALNQLLGGGTASGPMVSLCCGRPMLGLD